MEAKTNKAAEVQGTDAAKAAEQEAAKKAEEAKKAEADKVTENKKVQLSIKMLKELAGNQILLAHYIEIVTDSEEIKTPMAYQMAKMLVKQTKIEM